MKRFPSIDKFVPQNFRGGRNPLLELCPFCGESAEIFQDLETKLFTVGCSNNDCLFRPLNKVELKSEVKAIQAWNIRKGGN